MKFHVMPPSLVIDDDEGRVLDFTFSNNQGSKASLHAAHKRLLRYLLLSMPRDLYDRPAGIHKGRVTGKDEIDRVLGNGYERNRAFTNIRQMLAPHREQAGGHPFLDVLKNVYVLSLIHI